MFDFFKVWWHCLIRIPYGNHRMCKFDKKHFCECGFNNEGVTYDDMLEKLLKRDFDETQSSL